MSNDMRATASLFDVANRDGEVIDALEALVRAMKESQEARTQLAGMSAAELREALALRARERNER